jgi:hypothetical protein
MNDLNVNVLIKINIMSLEKCILNFKFFNMIFSSCDDIQMLITIVRTN